MPNFKKKSGGTLTETRPPVVIEYPRQGDTLTRPSYTFRVASVPEAVGVDIRLDGSGWQPCRQSLGMWWLDWGAFESGTYSVEARVRLPNGATALAEPRLFYVQLPN